MRGRLGWNEKGLIIVKEIDVEVLLEMIGNIMMRNGRNDDEIIMLRVMKIVLRNEKVERWMGVEWEGWVFLRNMMGVEEDIKIREIDIVIEWKRIGEIEVIVIIVIKK